MPLRRVRPMRRALVGGAVATAAYHGGQRKAGREQQAASTEARLEDLEAQQYAPPPAPAPAPAPVVAPAPAPAAAAQPDRLDELKKLAELKELGVLTDEEFAAEKARILAS